MPDRRISGYRLLMSEATNCGWGCARSNEGLDKVQMTPVVGPEGQEVLSVVVSRGVYPCQTPHRCTSAGGCACKLCDFP